MWVRRVVESTTIREKQFHACDMSEMLMKTKTMLEQASMYQNEKNFSLKSSGQHSYQEKHKKC